MLIILHGENSFLTKRKFDEIVSSYKAKHKSGLNFFRFEDMLDLFDFKSAFETVSMFSEKKLIVLVNVLSESRDNESVLDYLKSKIKEVKSDQERVLVFVEKMDLAADKNKGLKWLFDSARMTQESKNLTGAKLLVWIKQEAERMGGRIGEREARQLSAFCGSDLWRLSNEMSKLIGCNKNISIDHIRLLVREDTEEKIFDAVDGLINGDIKKALTHFNNSFKSSDDWPKTFGLIVSQYRNLLKIKTLQEEKILQNKIADKLKIHPFVVKKLLPVASKYSIQELRDKYKSLLEADFRIKTGQDSFQAMLERMILGL